MYALHVTFTATGSADELRAGRRAFAARLPEVRGLHSKTWLQDGSTSGGFYLFETEDDARAYVASPLFAALRRFPDLVLRGFAVVDEPARTTMAG